MNTFIVDDVPFIRELLRSCLVDIGHSVVGESSDGVNIINDIEKAKPDVIFIDLVLPFKNGLQVAEEVKKKFPEIHLIAISSLEKDVVLDKCLRVGFENFIPKPFQKHEIRNILNNIVSNKDEKNKVEKY